MVRVRRFRIVVLVLLMVALAASPALWADARRQSPSPTLGAAWGEDESWGVIGAYDILDVEFPPAVRCDNHLESFPGFVNFQVSGPSASIASNSESQDITSRARLYQIGPDGNAELIAQSGVVTKRVTSSFPHAAFPPFGFADQPIGPNYVVLIEINWHGTDGASVEGWIRDFVDHYQPVIFTSADPDPDPVERSCDSPILPVATMGNDQGIVNSRLDFDLFYFPINASLQVQWDSQALDPVVTDDRGEVHGGFRIPAAPMGPHTIRWFTGDWNVSETFTVVPRIKVTPGSAARGQKIDVSLRGYAAREIVRIRWRNGDSWVEIARVTTSGTGSANVVDVTVPAWAADGTNSVRGDAIAADGGRAQTNAVDVLPAGLIHLSPERGTVNSVVTATIANFPPNSPVAVTFHGFSEATASGITDGEGRAVLALRVPASPFGPHDVKATGGTTATTVFDVAPRIKLTPGEAAPGDAVGVSLRGFGARETVRIRWLRDGTYAQIATVTTSGSGSANLTVAVPNWAEDGAAAVRGDGTIGRAQTNAFVVAGGESAAAEVESSPTPSATAPPDGTPSPDLPGSPTEVTITPDPTTTVEPTAEPTAAPTQEPSPSPTVEATATVEPTPAETHSVENNEGES